MDSVDIGDYFVVGYLGGSVSTLSYFLNVLLCSVNCVSLVDR